VGEVKMSRKMLYKIFFILSMRICQGDNFVPLRTGLVEGRDNPTQLLIMLIENKENFLSGAISSQLAYHLYCQSGPILTSASLLRTIVTYRERSKSVKSIVETLQKNIALEEGYLDIGFSLLVKGFDSQAWHWFRVTDLVYLIIPRRLLINDRKKVGEWTEREIVSGFKIDHMKELEYDDVLKTLVDGSLTVLSEEDLIKKILKMQNGEGNIANYIAESILDGSVLLSRSEYRKINLHHMKQWIIFAGGHGSAGTAVAGLDMKIYRDFLYFLETKVLTRFLIVNSCYSTGLSSEIAFQDTNTSLQRTFSFPVVTSSLPNNMSTGGVLIPPAWVVDEQSKLVRPLLAHSCEKLREIISDTTNIKYLELVDCFIDRHAFNNFAFVRYSGRERFIPLWFAIEISDVLAKTRTKPLNIMEFARQKAPQVFESPKIYTSKIMSELDYLIVFLNARYIPFTLDLTTITMPIIMTSQIPDDTIHVISEIIIKDNDLFNLILTPHSPYILSLYIEKITSKQDKLLSLLFYDVIIVPAYRTWYLSKRDDKGAETKWMYSKKQLKQIENTDVKSLGAYQQLLQRAQQERYKHTLIHAQEIKTLSGIGDDALDVDVLRLIIQKGDDNVVKELSTRALKKALRKSDLPLALEALKGNPELSFRDPFGRTVLGAAVMLKSPFMIRTLIARGVNINEQTDDGWTALHYAALQDDVDVVRTLLSFNANIYLRNSDGKTAANVAIYDDVKAVLGEALVKREPLYQLEAQLGVMRL
jgi:hypothetical protein